MSLGAEADKAAWMRTRHVTKEKTDCGAREGGSWLEQSSGRHAPREADDLGCGQDQALQGPTAR